MTNTGILSRSKAVISIEEASRGDAREIELQKAAWHEFFAGIRSLDEELSPEFDEIIEKGTNLNKADFSCSFQNSPLNFPKRGGLLPDCRLHVKGRSPAPLRRSILPGCAVCGVSRYPPGGSCLTGSFGGLIISPPGLPEDIARVNNELAKTI